MYFLHVVLFYYQVGPRPTDCVVSCKQGYVADTFWSVHIKCCFHQKKVKSKRPTTSLNLLNGNAKAVISQARKTWQAKHHVYTKLPINTKLQTDQSGIQRQTVYKLNQIKFDLEKQRAKSEEKKANWAKEDPKRWRHGKVQKKAPLMMHARIMTKNPIKMPYKAIPEANQIMIN